MPSVYLKRATKTPETESGNARQVAEDMLAEIDRGGEQSVRACGPYSDNTSAAALRYLGPGSANDPAKTPAKKPARKAAG